MIYKQSGTFRFSHLGSPMLIGSGSFQINDFVIDNNYETWMRYKVSDQSYSPMYTNNWSKHG